MELEFIFFFQAEDGIRDVAVTGVQTCALPISRSLRAAGHLPANPEMAAIPSVCLRADLMDLAHSLFRRLGGLAGLAPDLLARVADPLAFVGLGRPNRADLRRHLAHELLVDALDLHEDVVVHRDLDPLRRVIWHRMGEADHELPS